MSTLFAAETKMDLGEKIHLRGVVIPECETELHFVIRNARYELWDPQGQMEQSGECVIKDHEIDALIQPKKAGTYKLKFIYEVADEIWIDVIKVVVR